MPLSVCCNEVVVVGEEVIIAIYLDEESILREKAQEALLSEIKELMQVLKPNQDEDKIKRACLELVCGEVFVLREGRREGSEDREGKEG